MISAEIRIEVKMYNDDEFVVGYTAELFDFKLIADRVSHCLKYKMPINLKHEFHNTVELAKHGLSRIN